MKNSKESSVTKSKFQKGNTVLISRDMVKDDDYNPRTISEANKKRLKKSIEKNGLVGTLVWNKRTGHIVGGHQRLESLDSLMRTKDYSLEVTEVDMSLKDEIRLNVALNQNDAQGEFSYMAIGELAEKFELDIIEDFCFSEEVADIQFPEFKEIDLDTGIVVEQAPVIKAQASAEDIAHMKELKHEAREKLKERREEVGDYNTEAKGILTIVFDRESAKKQFFLDRGIEDIPNVIHIYEFEKLMNGGVASEGNSADDGS